MDEANGAYLGEREVLRKDIPEEGQKAGTVVTLTAYRSGVVDELGAVPPR